MSRYDQIDGWTVPDYLKKCKTCKHYGFYRMIMDGPYSYAGPIPCLTCCYFSVQENNYESITPTNPSPSDSTAE